MSAVSAQIAVRRRLQDAFAQTRAKNPSVSLRAFARRLSIGHSALSEILAGKRAISRQMAERLARRLELSSRETKALLAAFAEKASDLDEISYLELSGDPFHVACEWHHFAILSLVETDDFRATPRWVARRLGIDVLAAEMALKRLTRLEMLVKGPRGKWTRGQPAYTTPDDVSSVLLRQAHAQNLELASRSLERDPVEERDFTSITMAIDPSKLPVAKKMIREFQDKISVYLETPPKAEVYRLCMQLFPLSGGRKRCRVS